MSDKAGRRPHGVRQRASQPQGRPLSQGGSSSAERPSRPLSFEGDAVWSGKSADDSEYRYALGRTFPRGTDTVNFIMLNPSTATETENDPSVRRCMGYAVTWGYKRLVVTNAFALRSGDPTALYAHPEPVGPENDGWIIASAVESDLVICAWGTHAALHDRHERILDLLRRVARRRPYALALTAMRGYPRHPLYLRADLRPFALT